MNSSKLNSTPNRKWSNQILNLFIVLLTMNILLGIMIATLAIVYVVAPTPTAKLVIVLLLSLPLTVTLIRLVRTLLRGPIS